MIILLLGAPHFTESPETIRALRIYSLSLIPAIMLTALLTVGHVKNLPAFLRSFALLIIFLAVLIVGVKILQRKGMLLPKMSPLNFFVINRQVDLELQANVTKILSAWVTWQER